MKKSLVVVAMSGGVNSSVAAGLLLQQGCDVIGITMQIWQELSSPTKGAGCCSLGAVEDARRVAAKLDIPHYTLNFRERFAEAVIDNFVDEYKRGRTPNPCVNCNRYVKFDALLEKAQSLGAQYLATGHYARVDFSEDTGRWRLRRAGDERKDQTYALYHFTQSELSSTLMPLGELTSKAETRQIARDLGLALADKPDSQEICFVQGGSYVDFLTEKAPETASPGKIRDTADNIRGEHDGIAFYTIGQRKRVNVGSPIPLYVVDIDPVENTVVVGTNEDLLAPGLIADDLNWISQAGVQESTRAMVKIRYNMPAVPAVVEPLPGGKSVQIYFDKPQRAVSPGQAAVLYDGDSVLGGGTILRRLQ